MERRRQLGSSAGALLLTACFLLFYQRCSVLKPSRAEPTPPAESKINEEKEAKPAPPVEAALAAEAMAANHNTQAMELYHEAFEKNPGNTALQAEYVAAIKLIKKEADSAKKKNNYPLALNHYRLLLQRYENFLPFAQSLSFSQADLKNEIKECQLFLQKNEVERAIKNNEYEKAITMLAATLNQYPQESMLVASLNQAVVEIKAAANQALQTADYGTAGKLFGLLKQAEIKSKPFIPFAPHEKEEIDRALRTCSLNLTNQGLIEYRKGNLKEAISLWEKILVFDPENEEIKKAIQTARTQLEKIKR